MLVAMSSTHGADRDLMALYAKRHGLETWVMLYEADVRAHLEHLSRMRRRAFSTEASGFMPALPWEWCMLRVVEDIAYWR